MVIDLNGDIIDINPKALEILGSPSAEATKQINMLTFKPLIDAGVSAIVLRSLGGETKIVDDIEYTSCWNKTSVIRFTATPIYDEQDFVCLSLIMMEDMTDYTSLKCELERNNKMLKNIIDAVPSLIWMKDAQGKYLFVNKSFEEFNSFVGGSIIGKTDDEIWPKEVAGAVKADDITAMECNYPLAFTEHIPHPILGGQWYRTTKIGICDKCSKLLGTVGVNCNITKQVEQDKILVEAIETLTSSLDRNVYVK
jgi:PAS domain-containing protein